MNCKPISHKWDEVLPFRSSIKSFQTVSRLTSLVSRFTAMGAKPETSWKQNWKRRRLFRFLLRLDGNGIFV